MTEMDTPPPYNRVSNRDGDELVAPPQQSLAGCQRTIKARDRDTRPRPKYFFDKDIGQLCDADFDQFRREDLRRLHSTRQIFDNHNESQKGFVSTRALRHRNRLLLHTQAFFWAESYDELKEAEFLVQRNGHELRDPCQHSVQDHYAHIKPSILGPVRLPSQSNAGAAVRTRLERDRPVDLTELTCAPPTAMAACKICMTEAATRCTRVHLTAFRKVMYVFGIYVWHDLGDLDRLAPEALGSFCTIARTPSRMHPDTSVGEICEYWSLAEEERQFRHARDVEAELAFAMTGMEISGETFGNVDVALARAEVKRLEEDLARARQNVVLLENLAGVRMAKREECHQVVGRFRDWLAKTGQ
ncbi:hypothetical protein BDZ85DRAFT_256115 [Elsinoe ampelina]|uniref:Uncharacterized protein n=1 Tax=Elsinoe ampelina TaxID=302913 RepID=A0A6A6GL03_9PEZI|nr:hypothetical protein BDZ85DRAFT_256115 [Elsinoe ampelina]